jgi:hypothetical protein
VSDGRAKGQPFDRALLERWCPALHYDPQEPYRAISAHSIADFPGNRLLLGDGTVLAGPGAAGGTALTLDLLQGYPGATGPSAADRLDETPDELEAARRFRDDPAYANRAYGRVAAHGGYTWLQYWLWLYYNPRHLLGFGRHEGDWELVQIGLDASGEPQLVTCSQHRTGEGRPWKRVSRQPFADGEHPVVYVAPFSHACYFEEGAHPYLGGIDNPDGSQPAELPQIEEIGKWRSWPGRWGNSSGVLGKGSLGGRSPRGPAHQGARWARPLDYHRAGQAVAVERRLGGYVRRAGTLTYPKLNRLSVELEGQSLRVAYETDRAPLRKPSHLLLTVHRLPEPDAPAGAIGEELLIRTVEIDSRRGTVALELPERLERCEVVASVFNRLRQRSDPMRESARQG